MACAAGGGGNVGTAETPRPCCRKSPLENGVPIVKVAFVVRVVAQRACMPPFGAQLVNASAVRIFCPMTLPAPAPLPPVFQHKTYLIRRKVLKLFGGAFHVYDAAGSVIGYSK